MNYKVGRNDFCPCGSKKKFKKCCMSFSSKAPFSERLKLRRVNPMRPKESEKVEEDNKLKGVQGGLCNVTRCQSDKDVNYCNEWNGNTYYCLDCAIDFIRHDKDWTQGYRFNCFVPHPLLCSQEEVKWFLEKGNTFIVPVEQREDGYWFFDYNQWFKVPNEKRKSLIVIDSHPADPGAHVVLRPEFHKGKHFEDICFNIGTEGLIWDNNVYSLDKLGARIRAYRNELFVVAKGGIQQVEYKR